jgi:1-pyrroline-5-carboxylate dehydrogenase
MATRVTYTSGEATPELDAAFDDALERAREGSVEPCRHVIGGRPVATGGEFVRENPARTDDVASRAVEGGEEAVGAAVEAAHEAQAAWRRLPYAERCAVLRTAADRIRERKLELAAVVTLETGKPRIESIAEVEEAADLIDTYCAQMEDHAGFTVELGRLSPAEQNVSVLRPYGVFGVIAPFNFPIALAAGMSSAALAAGNTVVMKPPEEAPRSGALLGEAYAQGGLPTGVVNVVHGGPATGAALAGSEVDGIAFTGSAEVGRAIARRLQDGSYGRPALTEMGGKNPAVVTEAADLEKAAQGIARSAFGFSGQKCSACSRAIVVGRAHDELVERLRAAAEELVVGDPSDRTVFTGPVVNATAVERFEGAAAVAGDDGTVAAGGRRLDLPGYYVAPTVVAGLARGHRLTREELFLPFVTVTAVDSFDEALAEANDVVYGLTAGIFSEDEAEVERFLEEIEAGVVYANRRAGATTGAWPGIQSFPGWKSSGTTGKGGLGPYYVQQFMREQSRTIVRD